MVNFINSVILTAFTFMQSLVPLPTYREGVIGQPSSFNPLKAGTNRIDRDISSLLFKGLVKYDLKGLLIPDLAESWVISADAKEYTFKLRPDAFWHDGVPISADDVIYTVSKNSQLKEIPTDKLDNKTVRFRLKEPLAPFLDILTISIIPAHLGDKNSDLRPVGSGEFRVHRLKKTDRVEQLTLQSRSRRLVFSFYTNWEELLTGAKLGEIDGFLGETPQSVEPLINFNYYRLPVMNRYYALYFNLNKEILKDNDLRKSLALSTPKEKITKEIYNDWATITNGPLDGNFAESGSYKNYLYDPNLDKNYNLSLTLTTPAKNEHRTTAEFIKESWEKIGIRLSVKEVAPDKILNEVIGPKNFDILLLGQEVSRDPDRYTLWHSTQKDLPGLNFISFKQIRVDRALEEGRKAQSIEERLTHYENLQTVFGEEVPAIFLYRPVAVYAIKKKIHATGLEAVFFLKDRLADFESWEFK